LTKINQGIKGCVYIKALIGITGTHPIFLDANRTDALTGAPQAARSPFAESQPLDINKQFVYNLSMIQSFASSETERFFATGKSRRVQRCA